jgi:aconitate hydratase
MYSIRKNRVLSDGIHVLEDVAVAEIADNIASIELGRRASKAIDLRALKARYPQLSTAPLVRLIFLENMLRHSANTDAAVAAALGSGGNIEFRPSRVIMQDASGLPALLDIASLRSLVAQAGGDPAEVDLSCKVDLVIDHSIRAAFTGPRSREENLSLEYHENAERYGFFKWAEQAFQALDVVPPDNGIIHQVNLESLASVTSTGNGWIFPETLVGTDSHTTMINGIGVLGWGLGGIEATAILLGNPIVIPSPQVIGIRLSGTPGRGILTTDIALRLCERLRAENVVDCFIEFFGPGVASLTVPDRATISNMAPEYGATACLFGVDEQTVAYLHASGRPKAATRSELYWKRQGLFGPGGQERSYDRVLDFDLGSVGLTIAGPSLPHQARTLKDVAATLAKGSPAETRRGDLADGDIVIASITSCTNTSNPRAMIAAGLLARNARRMGLALPPQVKASFSPGSRAVPFYLDQLGLLAPLEELGFRVAGYGCMTCVGNSGDIEPAFAETIKSNNLNVAAVLSGNRNFEGRIHPLIKSNYLASPPLVLAYALAGSVLADLETAAFGGSAGETYRLADLWPDDVEIAACLAGILPAAQPPRTRDTAWEAIPSVSGTVFPWSSGSTYIRAAPFDTEPPGARILEPAVPLLWLGDAVTTDHISPVGRILEESPAGAYLKEIGVGVADFNTYGARRGNSSVMRRGTFANHRLQNRLADGRTGPWTRYLPTGEIMPLPDAADLYQADGMPVVVLAGDAYGTGSARDWAAKGTAALGIRAVIARGFERIHRTNLAYVGVLPLEWTERPNLDGTETFGIDMPAEAMKPNARLPLTVRRGGQLIGTFEVDCRLDTDVEVDYWRRGGFLRKAASQAVSNKSSRSR